MPVDAARPVRYAIGLDAHVDARVIRRWLPELDAAHAWDWTRIFFALAALATWIPRGPHVIDVYSSEGIVLATGAVPLTRWVIFSPTTAFILFGLLILSLVAVGLGRATRPALLTFLVTSFALVLSEGLSMKAYDRLMGWEALVLLFAPSRQGSRDALGAHARIAMIVVFCGLYAGTGWHKLLDEPGWRDGAALASHLVDRSFGETPLGYWLADHMVLVKLLSWWTVAFEVAFSFLVWFRRFNPWLLLVGLSFHLGVFALLRVGTFSLVALAPYPLLLHPEAWPALRARIERLTRRGHARREGPVSPGG